MREIFEKAGFVHEGRIEIVYLANVDEIRGPSAVQWTLPGTPGMPASRSRTRSPRSRSRRTPRGVAAPAAGQLVDAVGPGFAVFMKNET